MALTTTTTFTTVDTIAFNPSDTASPPQSFTFQLENAEYTASVWWNVAGQRYYLVIYDSSGDVVINHPMVSSPPASPINLAPGIFASSGIAYNKPNATITTYTITTVTANS